MAEDPGAEDLEWESFMQAYAEGRWDPAHVSMPRQTRSLSSTPGHSANHSIELSMNTMDTVALSSAASSNALTIGKDVAAAFSFPVDASGLCGTGNAESLQYIGASANRRAVHDVLFNGLPYLAPPMPPDEFIRRRALYRYNILRTAKDANFDRICHIVKLIFKTKMVVITLIEGATQHHKSEIGLGADEAPRTVSFCAHTILQRTDQPVIVLDATKDWRFAQNPLVTGPPSIRFYAGAPLRTPDGYNVGTLCIVDDVSRTDFSPRDRDTLKEFAAVVMRELELWRDKIQLKIRDRIQTSMERFTRRCLEMDIPVGDRKADSEVGMKQVFREAASLVRDTLDMEGGLLLDISHFEAAEVTDDRGKRTVLYHGSLFDASPTGSDVSPRPALFADRLRCFGPLPALPVLAVSDISETSFNIQPMDGEEHKALSTFLSRSPEGEIFEIPPPYLRKVMPEKAQRALVVPVFSIDHRPFLLFCAYASKRTNHYLEGFELHFIRAVGVIIMSAVLKRRLVLADTAKSLFISNISHELRTPLHGILASAELLHDTQLSQTQTGYLSTVKACAQSLAETVNHVLDFSKLSHASDGAERDESPSQLPIDLPGLLEDTAEACWLGAQARHTSLADLGGFYARSEEDSRPGERLDAAHVEIVVDISPRVLGWSILSDRGGIRRIFTNLISNSIKYTENGFVQVRLRELPNDRAPHFITVEIAVFDSGKGMSEEFLQNRIFQPFSQENSLQTGTGLGLAIVNSIRTSLGATLDVWSAENFGTEIKLTLEVKPGPSQVVGLSRFGRNVTVRMAGFGGHHLGTRLLRDATVDYLLGWWGFEVLEDDDSATEDILLLNDPKTSAYSFGTGERVDRPIIILSSRRRDIGLSIDMAASELGDGLCQIIFKPSGPVRLERALRNAMARLRDPQDIPSPVSTPRSYRTASDMSGLDVADQLGGEASMKGMMEPLQMELFTKSRIHLERQVSEDIPRQISRPTFASRNSMYEGLARPHASLKLDSDIESASETVTTTVDSTLTMTHRGNLVMTSDPSSTLEGVDLMVMVVDDNPINRSVLVHWLKKRGTKFREAVDGQEALDLFADHPLGFFDVILLDLSMPRLDGFEAAKAIRSDEQTRRQLSSKASLPLIKIFALTGLASLEDKRKAFAAGVDGYLVKPMPLKTLDNILCQITPY